MYYTTKKPWLGLGCLGQGEPVYGPVAPVPVPPPIPVNLVFGPRPLPSGPTAPTALPYPVIGLVSPGIPRPIVPTPVPVPVSPLEIPYSGEAILAKAQLRAQAQKAPVDWREQLRVQAEESQKAWKARLAREEKEEKEVSKKRYRELIRMDLARHAAEVKNLEAQIAPLERERYSQVGEADPTLQKRIDALKNKIQFYNFDTLVSLAQARRYAARSGTEEEQKAASDAYKSAYMARQNVKLRYVPPERMKQLLQETRNIVKFGSVYAERARRSIEVTLNEIFEAGARAGR